MNVKVAKKGKKKIAPKKVVLFFCLIAGLFLSLIFLQQRQIYKQEAATCGMPGDKGNELGVGKFCTAGGNECQNTQAPYCSLDFANGVPGICSNQCSTDADCGTGAFCAQTSPINVCQPNTCTIPSSMTPTSTATPSASSGPTPSPTINPIFVCGGVPCPSGVVPTAGPTNNPLTIAPTVPPVPPVATPAGNAGFLALFLQFLRMILSFFTQMGGRGI